MSKRRDQSLTIVSILIFSTLFIAGCNSNKEPNPEKEIDLLMRNREIAIKQKDINLYMKCISRAYNHNSKTFEMIIKEMEENFNVFDGIDFSTSKRKIYPEDKALIVVQDYDLVFSLNGKSEHYHGKERIFLIKEDSGWKIIKGL